MGEYKPGSVLGLSSLREKDHKAVTAAESEVARERQKYLAAKYLSEASSPERNPKKRRKKARKGAHVPAVRMVDEDADWDARPRAAASNSSEEAVHDAVPVVVNEVEIRHQLIMEKRAREHSSRWANEDASTPASTGNNGSHVSVTHAKLPQRHDSDVDEDDLPRRRAAGGETSRAGRVQGQEVELQGQREHVPLGSQGDSLLRRGGVAGQTRHDSDGERPPSARASDLRARSSQHGHDSDDESPPRRGGMALRTRHDSDDESPPRRGAAPGPPLLQRHDSDDQSPPRQALAAHKGAPSRPGSDDESPPRRVATAVAQQQSPVGASAALRGGVTNAEDLKAHTRQRRAEEQARMEALDATVSGRGASSVYRVAGKLVSKEEYERRTGKRQPRFLEEDVGWKRGLAQARAAEAEQASASREAAKHFQREYDDDADAAQRGELRVDDPMASHIAAARAASGAPMLPAPLLDRHTAELAGTSGFLVPQEVPEHSWIRRRVQPMANRYGIRPGRHWDGVHRSNGFEHNFVFAYRNKRALQERDRYVDAEDM